jgi:hypothetical protein
MKSYLPVFDWNNGNEVDPFGWLYEDEERHNKKVRSISIRKK